MDTVAAINAKRVVYVGGLSEEVTEDILRSAMIPFGEVLDVQMPIDYTTQKHRGFGFVEFEVAEDAASAVDNMNSSEIFGRTVRVNVAKSVFHKRPPEHATKPVWANDEWIKRYVMDDDQRINDQEHEPKDLISTISLDKVRTFLEIQIDGRVIGKIVVQLFTNVVPRTCENFRRLCLGDVVAAGHGATKANALCYTL